jgi:acyl carrier protein
MPDSLIVDRVRARVSYYSGAAEEGLSADSSPKNTAGWDSVANLGIMSAVEDEFGVTVATRDVIKLRTLGDIAAYVAANAKPLAEAKSATGS